MRDRYDALGKDVLVASLRDVGEVERGVETGAVTQRVDVLFRPDAAHRAERMRRGLLGALVEAAECDLEPFRNTPPREAVRDCVRRLWNHHHVRALEGSRADPPEKVPLGRVVVISPGRPEGALEVFAMEPAAGLPAGVYCTHDDLGLWVVALSELPETRDTLALRLLGKGAVLRRAVEALMALPADAWERRLVEILVQWRYEVATHPAQSEEDEDFMTATMATWEQEKARIREEAANAARASWEQEKGRIRDEAATAARASWEQEKNHIREQGLSQGLSQGLLLIVHQFERRLGRPLTAPEHDTLAQRLHTVGPERLGDVVLDLSPDALAAWLAAPAER
jgi:hypothetical protein